MRWKWKKTGTDDARTHHSKAIPVIFLDIAQVKKSVRDFENSMPKGINRTVLVRDDQSIDFTKLVPLLGGMPDKAFYMSRETFEIFPEDEAETARWMDIVQRAVDDYCDDHRNPPVVEGDPDHKISYYLLKRDQLLKETPPMDFYLTKYDGLISHKPL